MGFSIGKGLDNVSLSFIAKNQAKILASGGAQRVFFTAVYESRSVVRFADYVQYLYIKTRL